MCNSPRIFTSETPIEKTPIDDRGKFWEHIKQKMLFSAIIPTSVTYGGHVVS
jgi:hypothetical protein